MTMKTDHRLITFVMVLAGILMISTSAKSPSPTSSSSSSSLTPSSAKEDKALLTAMKNSGPGFGITTYIFLAFGILGGVDVTPLIWHCQWVTFAPFLEGYAGNNTIIWTKVAPPKGNNPDGVVFRYEEWGSNFWPIALNITWINMEKTVALDFDSCTAEEKAALAGNSSTNVTASTKRRLRNNDGDTDANNINYYWESAYDDYNYNDHGRRLPNIETCELKDTKNIKRVTTFINVCFSYLIFGIIAIIIQLVAHFLSKKKWDEYLGGRHWITKYEDLENVKPWTFIHIPFTSPRMLLTFVLYIGFQPMVFGCMMAISTGNTKYVIIGLIMFLLLVAIPLVFQYSWVNKYVIGVEDATLIDENVHKVSYQLSWKRWRDMDGRTSFFSWRKSITTAGWGVLFNDYAPKWKLWLTIWLSTQAFILIIVSPLIPMPAKIQAITIMAVYFIYFVVTGLMMPFRSMSKYFIHLLMSVHNGVACVFTQFVDPEGLLNSGPSSVEEGATEADGILTALGSFGMCVLYIYITISIVFKILAIKNENTPLQKEEDFAEFRGR
jgi:hypothetical protein